MVRDQLGQFLYPVHRLDRPVSGVLIFALNKEAGRKLKDIWPLDETQKEYLTLSRGVHHQGGTHSFALRDHNKVEKPSITHYWPLFQFENTTLHRVIIKTGRMHQIRRHFSRRMMNIIGDTKYGKGPINNYFREEYDLKRIFLHCTRIYFTHPYSGIRVKIHSPLPEDLKSILQKLGLNTNDIEL